jgi:beta-lactam-binding protein with PASTA domain
VSRSSLVEPGGALTFKVFISYRREDCPGHAGRIFDRLRARFGPTSVFMDVTDIEAGVDFVEVLERAVGSCDVLLAVIGTEWISATDRSGRRRLDDPQDFIRLEIGAALKRNVRVIPVLVEGAMMPRAEELPPDLAALVRRQAVELRDIHWNADVEDLTAALDRVLPSSPGPASQPTGWPRRLIAVGALGAAAAAIAIGIGTRESWQRFVSAGPSGVVAGGGPTPAPSQPSPAPVAPAVRESASIESPKGGKAPDAQPAEAAAVPESDRTPPAESRPVAEPGRVTPPRPEAKPPSRPIASGTPLDVARFGMKVADAVDSLSRAARPGAIVTDITRGGTADEAGIRDGDLIMSVNATRIAGRDDLERLAAGTAVSGSVVVRLMRDNAGRTIEMTVAEPSRGDGNTRNSSLAPGGIPNVVGLSIGEARDALASAGFITRLAYVESTGKQGMIQAQAQPSVDAQNRNVIVLQVGILPAVFVYHASSARRVAEDLATHLREALGSRLSVSVTERKPSELREGEVKYGGEGFESLAATVARAASSKLSQMHRRQIALVPALDEKGRPGALWILVPAPDSPALGGSTREGRPAAVPNVVGMPTAAARESLTRAGFGIRTTYVEPMKEKAGIVLAQSPPSVDAENRPVVALSVGIAPTVLIYHTPAGARAAEDLAAYLRQAMGDRVPSVRPIEYTPAMREHELWYGGTGFETLAAIVARAASSRLSQMYRRPITLVPSLDEKGKPGILQIVVSAPDSPAAGGSPRTRPSGAVPNVVGMTIAAARESLTRAGFAVEQKYVDLDRRAQPPQQPGQVLGQDLLPVEAANVTPRVVLRVGATAVIVVLYGRDDEQSVAGELADHLRQVIRDPQYVVKTTKSARADSQRGALHYRAGGLDALVERVSAGAGPWLNRRMGSDARLYREIQPRMAPMFVVLTLPDAAKSNRK